MATNTRPRKNRGRVLTSDWPYGRWSNPLFAAFEVYVCGIAAKAFNINTWYIVIAGAVCVATISLVSRVKHVRQLGMGYGAALTTAVTAWLAWASGHTTFSIHDADATKRSMMIVAILTIPFAVVYAVLLHNQVKSTKKAAEKADGKDAEEIEHWANATAKAGIKNWMLIGEEQLDNGVIAHMQIMPGGTPYARSLSLIDPLETNLGVNYRGAVKIVSAGRVNLVDIIVNDINVLAEDIYYTVNPTPTSITRPIEIGAHENGDSASTVYAWRSTLTIGQREGGKSNYLNVLLAEFGRCTDVVVWVVDFKQGSVVKPWLAPYAAGMVDRPYIDWVVTTPGGVEAMCDALINIGNRRAANRVGDKVRIGPSTPAIRLMIDEIADLLADPKWSTAANKLMLILRKMRSEGIDIELFSQRGTMSFLGTHGRDLQSQTRTTVLFRLDNAAELYNAIGLPKSRLGGVDPSTFEYPGTALIVTSDVQRTPVKIRRIEDDQIIQAAQAYGQFRPSLPAADSDAAGRAYANRWSTPDMRSILEMSAKLVGGEFQPAHVMDSEPTAKIIALPTAIDDDDEADDDEADDSNTATETDRRREYTRARTLLSTMAIFMSKVEAMPTSAVLDRLAARGYSLTAKGLAKYMKMVRVEPRRLGGEYGHGTRGYVTADVRDASRWVKDHSVQSLRENI